MRRGRKLAAAGDAAATEHWPVRWRLAAVSAGLTLVILLSFGAVIGQVATQRIRDDFNRQVSSAAQTLAGATRVFTPVSDTSSPRAQAR